MVKTSAGLLMYKIKESNGRRELMVFIGHPGGSFFKGKETGAWSIPKGEIEEGEDLFSAGRREFKEETGIGSPENKEKYIYLGEIRQKSGKRVFCWAFEGDWTGLLMGTSFVELEYNGKKIKFPEMDGAGFFGIEEAKKKINPAQRELIDRLREKLNIR